MRMGSMFRELCRWEVGGTFGMITGDSETLCTCVILTCLGLRLLICRLFTFCTLATQRNAYFCANLYRQKSLKLSVLYVYDDLLNALCILMFFRPCVIV